MICPKCGRPTRLDSPGLFGLGHLELVIGCLVFAGVMFAILYPVFRQAKESAKQVHRLSIAKQMAMGTILYLADFDDTFPPYKTSVEAASQYEKYLLQDELKVASKTYTWNVDLSGLSYVSIENIDSVWMLHSSELGDGKHIVAYGDTHCKVLSEPEFQKAVATKPKFFEPSK
jgi:hypothetical protein